MFTAPGLLLCGLLGLTAQVELSLRITAINDRDFCASFAAPLDIEHRLGEYTEASLLRVIICFSAHPDLENEVFDLQSSAHSGKPSCRFVINESLQDLVKLTRDGARLIFSIPRYAIFVHLAQHHLLLFGASVY